MKGEKLSAAKAQSFGAAEQRRDIPRSYSLRFEHSNTLNTTERKGRNL